MGVGAGPAINLTAAKKQLADVGIEFELLTPDAYEAEDDPYFNFDGLERIDFVSQSPAATNKSVYEMLLP
jgi:hypothetical protein